MNPMGMLEPPVGPGLARERATGANSGGDPVFASKARSYTSGPMSADQSRA